jgi:hypothetical protein
VIRTLLRRNIDLIDRGITFDLFHWFLRLWYGDAAANKPSTVSRNNGQSYFNEFYYGVRAIYPNSLAFDECAVRFVTNVDLATVYHDALDRPDLPVRSGAALVDTVSQ